MRIGWPDYAMHALHTRAAEPTSELWRLLIALALMVLVCIFLSLIYSEAIAALVDAVPGLSSELVQQSTPRAMYLVLGSFAMITLSVCIVVRVIHQRPALSVLGPLPLMVPHFLRATLAAVLFFTVVAVLPPYDMGAPYVPNMAPVTWALLLPISLAALFLQISAEEVVFRGYLQQQLGARFRSPLMWLVLPSALFALAHYQPGELGANAWPVVLWAFLFGLAAADLTARTGNIGAALALHFTNNISSLLVVSLPDSPGGLALFHAPFAASDAAALGAWLPSNFAMTFCLWLAARIALRR